MNKRIRMVRDELDLSRAAFGKRLGISGDVVNNLERGRVEIKEHMLKLICTEYSVNEDWLKTGNGNMFCEPDTFSLDQLAKDQGATPLELEIMKAYFGLDKDMRNYLIEYFKSQLTSATATEITESTKSADNFDYLDNLSVEELEAEYKKNISKIASKKAATVSNITEGNPKVG